VLSVPDPTLADLKAHLLSLERFYGFTENSREVEMDMREMVNKVKNGQPLYGTSSVSSYLQGVAARNSRYSELFVHILPWFNLVNHDQVSCADAASCGRNTDIVLARHRHGKILPAS